MKWKGLLVALPVVVLAVSSPVQARLGESETECRERYGEPAEARLDMAEGLAAGAEKWKALLYTTRGLRIQVVFKNGEAVFIKYANAPVFSLDPERGAAIHLSRREIERLRSANAAEGERWSKHPSALVAKLAPQLTIWKTGDDRRLAGYDREQRELFVCDSSFWELVVGEVRKRHAEGDGAADRLEGL